MTKIVSAFSILAIVLGALYAGSAEAQSHAWVSGGGNDGNPCTRTQPCATFNAAFPVAGPGGEIDVLDSGDFGPLVIYHAITIANDGAGTASITPSGSTPAINIVAGAADAVVLRGLNFDGVNSQASAVQFLQGGSLLIDHCTIEGFSNPALELNPLFQATLWVTDTVLANDGNSASAAVSMFAQNSGNRGLTAHLERVQILHATGNAIRVDGTGSTRSIDVELRDVTADASTGTGIVALSSANHGVVNLMADNVTSSHNAGYGLRAVGTNASVYLSRSVITDNGVGVAASSGGEVFSYGDNRFAANTSGDGTAPTPIGPK